MKERAASAESELELTRSEGQAALEAEQDRCHDEISRVRKAAAESAAEASRRSSIQSAEISSLNVTHYLLASCSHLYSHLDRKLIL